MIAHKHITKIIAVVMAVAVCLCLCAVAFSPQIAAAMGDMGISMEYETKLFDTSSILTVNILMDDADWNDMLTNATAEEYYQCDVEVNGTTFYRVGIRPKGNTSLTSIASDPTTDRYSFKLEFDHYVDGQSCFGLDKLILNNNYADATNMKEALIYDMYQYLGADASLYNYAKISVNGEYWGVYLALEAVEDSFMLRNYGAQSGKLYKPDSMNIGDGKDFGDFNADDMDFGNMTPPDTQGNANQANSSAPSQTPDTVNPPQNRDSSGETSAEPSTDSGERPSMDFNFAGGKGGFSMSGGGADLNYTDDELDSYETIWDGEVTSTKKSDHKRVVNEPERVAAKDMVYEIVRNTAEYMRQMETALFLKADGLEDGYKVLADFNGTVLAGVQSKHGVHFVTWDWAYGHTGVCHGHYFMENYAGAKQDFAIRSGLIQKERLFTPEQMTEIYRCCADSVDGDFFELTGEQEKMIRSVQQQIEECVPDLDERIRQQEDTLEQIAQEQTM